jgi:hypothetical protein
LVLFISTSREQTQLFAVATREIEICYFTHEDEHDKYRDLTLLHYEGLANKIKNNN